MFFILMMLGRAIDEAYFLQHGVEQRHVGLLGLDGVAEEGVGLVGQERVNGHLLDSENERRFAQILLDHGASLNVFLLIN